MTGKEFEAGMKRLGMSQAELARTLGIHRQTIAAKCIAAEVEPLYRAAMIGLLSEKSAGLLVVAVEQSDTIASKRLRDSTKTP